MDIKSTLYIFTLVLITWIERTNSQKPKCGVSKVSGEGIQEDMAILHRHKFAFPYVQSRGNRVVGGTESQPHAWPWMAALIRGNYYICGGVLIDERFVLTAAHCVIDRPTPSLYRVVLGAHNLYQGEVYGVSRVVFHPTFNQGLPPRGNDIAILRLSRNANISSPNIGLICMPTFYLTGAGGRECVVTGWGRISEGGPPSQKLQEVKVPIVDNGVCNSRDYYGGLIGPTMLCAGWEEGGKDTCQGDSGGPLVCDVNGEWQVHGIVSWGYGCARARKPGVYARVSVLQPWISSQLSSLSRNDEIA